MWVILRVPLGLIVIGVLCYQQMPRYVSNANLLSVAIAGRVVIGSSLFALALGLLQSLFDLRTDSRAFLLHRPISARDIFWGKVSAGFVAHLLAWGVPLLIAAIYLESIGPERLPVTWSDVVLPAIYCLVSFLFHPAGMWIACREARWVGTKCLPLAVPVVACFAVMVFSEVGSAVMLSFFAGLIIVLSWMIVAAARHAFTRQTFLPSPATAESWSWPNALGLGVASIIAVMVVTIFLVVMTVQQNQSRPTTAHRLASSSTGQLWEIKESWKSPRMWQDKPIHRTGRQITGAESSTAFVELDETWREQALMRLPYSMRRTSFVREFAYRSFSASTDNGGSLHLIEHNNQLYVYGDHRGWVATVTPQGVFASDETPLGTFSNLITLDMYLGTEINMSIGGHRLLADDNGIYQLDVDARQLRKLSDTPAASMAITLPSDTQPEAMLWAYSNETVFRFSVRPRTEGETLPSINSELIKATHQYPLANFEMTPSGTWSLMGGGMSEESSLTVSSTSEQGAIFVATDIDGTWTYRVGTSDGALGDAITQPNIRTHVVHGQNEFFLLPPGLSAGISIVAPIVSPEASQTMPGLGWQWLLVALHSLIGAAGAFLLVRSRVHSASARTVWLVIAVLLGIYAWLAVIAIYPRSVTEQCTACSRRRRVDLDRCEHCGADWEIPDGAGIELIGLRDVSPADISLTSTS
ncbi:MAG: hypothetical protein ACI8P0_004938 [Planctomycetaceae bacterium]